MKTNFLKPVVAFTVIAVAATACKDKTEVAVADTEPHGI